MSTTTGEELLAKYAEARWQRGELLAEEAAEAKAHDLTAEEFCAAKLTGMSPAEYAAFRFVGSIRQYKRRKLEQAQGGQGGAK